MDERGANIDLLFRNGLKDYEVLPPEDVWSGIGPAIKPSKGLFFFKVAAMVAVLISLGVVAYMVGKNTVIDAGYGNSAFNIPISDPLQIPSLAANFMQPDFTEIESVISAHHFATEEPGIPEILIPETSAIDEIIITDYISSPIAGSYTGNVAVAVSSKGEQDVQAAEIPGFFPVLAQTTAKERWSVSAMASPTYYARIGSANALPDQLMSSEQTVASYSGGFAVSYKINKRFSIQTGVYYARRGNEIEGVNSFSGFDKYLETKGGHNFELQTINGRVFTSNGDLFLLANGQGGKIQSQYTADIFDPQKASLRYVSNSIVQNFSYLQMPVMLRYKLIDKNLDFNVVGGISYDLLIGNSAFIRAEGEKLALGSTHGLNSFLFSSSLGMGMEYSFSKKLSLNFEPTLRYFLSPFGTDGLSGLHPYSVGVFSGFSYKF